MQRATLLMAVLILVPAAQAVQISSVAPLRSDKAPSDAGSMPAVTGQTNGGGVIVTVEFLTDIPSWDSLWDPDNVVALFDIGALTGYGNDAAVHGIGWDVGIKTFGQSWLSEASMYFDDNVAPDAVGLFLTPGAGDDFPGTQYYSSGGIIILPDVGIPDVPLPDGWLRLEFFELYDDYPDEVDANYIDGSTIDLLIIPEPASLALLMLSGVAVLRRRR